MEVYAKLFGFTAKGKEEGRVIRQHVTAGRGVGGARPWKKKTNLPQCPPGVSLKKKKKYNGTL